MPPISPDVSAIHKLRVGRMMDGRQLNARRRAIEILSHIIEHETTLGTHFMMSGNSIFVYLGMTNEVAPIPPVRRGGDRIVSYLSQLYGITLTDKVGEFVYAELRNHALNHAAKVDMRRFAAYNAVEHTVYLSAYDGYMWKLEGGAAPARVTNGEDEIFFADDDGGRHTDVDYGPHGILIDRLTDLNYAPSGLGGITPIQQRRLLTVWLFMLAFPDKLRTKPMLIAEGGQGSGKSAFLQLIQLALMGQSKAMMLSQNKQDDFGVVLLRSPIALFDNTDSYISWVGDEVCGYATNGMWARRVLHTTSDEAILRPHAFIAIASKNPASFRREDTADRCLILRLERREEFRRFEALEQEILAQRPQLLGEYLYYVNQIVEHLRATNADDDVAETTRMADFAYFARAVGAVMHWEAGGVDELLVAAQAEANAFAGEEDALVELLHKWVPAIQGGVRNMGREVTIFELFNDLNSTAQAEGIGFYKHARELKQKIRSPFVAREFIVEMPIVKGQKKYRIWRRTDPQLTSIPAPDDLPAIKADDEDT